MKRIYLDYASLTPIDPRVLRVMKRYSSTEYANPSSIYREGVAAKRAMNEGRAAVAGFIHAHTDEVVFTGGGTEANNIAIGGVLKVAWKRMNTGAAGRSAKPHLIISNIEHSSIMEMAHAAEKAGCEVTQLAVNQNGVVDVHELKKALKPETVLVSIMTVNNEIGTIQPIREIAKTIRQWRKGSNNQQPTTNYQLPTTKYPLLHTDAAQAALCDELNVEKLGVDLMTLDSSKVYGPRGVGALFVRRAVTDDGLIEPIMHGGGQERGLRSGTENLPGIMGFAKALLLAGVNRERECARLRQLKDSFLAGLVKMAPDPIVNPRTSATCAPHILNVSIPGIDNEFFVLQLDAAGIAVSTKSSCLRDQDESYVLKAIGADSRTSVRFSFGRFTKKADIKRVLGVIEALRE
ncbi:MAG: cysteine desulfurase [Patescibacteria group bacterium]|nr:cysteine desulfurase [Patescibacteria group bacterium]